MKWAGEKGSGVTQVKAWTASDTAHPSEVSNSYSCFHPMAKVSLSSRESPSRPSGRSVVPVSCGWGTTPDPQECQLHRDQLDVGSSVAQVDHELCL